MAKIVYIGNKKLAKKYKIKKGDDVIEFNNKPFFDILDYLYNDAKEEFSVTIIRENDEKEIINIKKDEYDSLEWEFEESLEICPYTCHNNCIFCFVKQLPKNLRETLYVKDDDYRTSFLDGSYITLTNLKENEIERIIELKLSPIYVSVHATDMQVRNMMLGVKRSCDILALLNRFLNNDIKVHTQVVMVEGINDDKVLYKTLEDLYNLGESLLSVAIVPVGLTNHREGLYPIKTITKECANNTIDMVEKFYSEKRDFCICADEMYQIAHRELPPYEYYKEFEQYENGVGLIAKFLREVEEEIEFCPKKVKHNKSLALITGVAGYNTIEKAVSLISSKIKGLNVKIYRVINQFFGDNVTVTGLTTAGDISKHLADKEIEDAVVIPSIMLKADEEIFLDDVSVDELSKMLNRKIIISGNDGASFVDTLIYGE